MIVQWLLEWIVKGSSAALGALPSLPTSVIGLADRLRSASQSLALAMPYRSLVPWDVLNLSLAVLAAGYASSIAFAFAYRVFSWIRSLGKSSD